MSLRAPARLLVRLLVTAVVVALAGAIAPAARACACGALLSDDPRMRVSGETAVVRWDGVQEEIILQMAVDSDRKDAALLLPTPAPATVRLGDSDWFTTLGRVSAPRPRYVDDWWPDRLFDPGPMAGAPLDRGGPDVTVHDETDVGPYHVASLSAREPKSLSRWLKANGYRMKGAVASALAPYVKRGWRYTAVKLRATGGRLSGALSPLRVRFAAAEPVYPMRLSHAITADQAVRLYVLTPHRMRPASGGVAFTTSYAGRLDPRSWSAPFTGLLGQGTTYLTTLDGTARPGAVTDDVRFARVPDKAYRRTTTVASPVYIVGVAGGPLLVALGVLALLAVAVLIVGVQWARRTGRRSVQTGSSGS